jgi:hypothetical protein
MSDKEIVDRAIGVLRKKYRGWNWRTNNGLAKEIGVEPKILRKVLSEHASTSDRVITFSNLPSRKTIDILWGLVENVGDNFNKPSLKRVDSPETSFEVEVIKPPYAFLSHNSIDSQLALELAIILNENDVKCWLFECHIGHGRIIIDAVRKAMRECHSIIALVTRNSVGSLWVQKEFAYSYDQLQKPVFLILDGKDEILIEFVLRFKDLIYDRNFNNTIKSFAQNIFPEYSSEKINEWSHHAKGFLFSIKEYINANRKLVAYQTKKDFDHPDLIDFNTALGSMDWIKNSN